MKSRSTQLHSALRRLLTLCRQRVRNPPISSSISKPSEKLQQNFRETPEFAANLPGSPPGIVPVHQEWIHTVSYKHQPLAPHPAATTGELPLSPQRAFVVQFRAGPAPWTGRVEHVTSGRAVRFRSAEELWAFLMRALTDVERQSP